MELEPVLASLQHCNLVFMAEKLEKVSYEFYNDLRSKFGLNPLTTGVANKC